MNASKVSQKTIDSNIQNMKKHMNKQDVQECKIGLYYADSNKDGRTTGIDMYKKWSSTCESIFAGDAKFAQRGEELSMQMGELYSRYAGSDGKLDAYEYNAALQSDEMGVLIEEYWEMKNIVEAQQGEEVKGLSHYDSNRDGGASSVEIFKERSSLYSKIFGDNKTKQAKSQEIIQQQAEILDKYAGDDGILSSEEYSEAVKSREYQKTLTLFKKLM